MKKSELKALVKEEIENIIKELDIADCNDDNEGEVLNSELASISNNAQTISSKIASKNQPIEAWVQSHISAAKELISHVASYIADEEDEEAGEEAEKEEVPSEESPEVDANEEEPLKENIGPNEKKVIEDEIAKLKAIAKRTPEEDGKLKDLEEKLKLSESKDNEKKVIDAEISNLERKPNKSAADITRLKDLKLKLVSCGAACMAIPGGFIKKEEKEIKGSPIAKVKKSDASKVKDMAKEFAVKGEHANILKMVKKLENYLKTHIKKEVE